MTVRFLARQLGRESRGSRGRLLFFAACLGAGVAAVVAVATLSAALDDGIRSQARSLLAADLAVESLRPLPAALDAAVAAIPGARRTDVVELVTVVFAPGATRARSLLVELKAVDPPYPFYGTLVLDPPRPLASLLGDDGAVVAPDVLSRLGLGVGASISIGGRPFRVTGVVRSEPDRVAGAFSLGPRVLVSRAALGATPLEGFGSRVARKALVRLDGRVDAARLARAAAALGSAVAGSPSAKVQPATEAQPALRQAVARVARFLGLVALLSLLVGGVGVAQTVRAWVASRLDSIAVLRCLGVRPREVLALYVAQTALLALAGSLAGAIAGTLVGSVLPHLYADLLPAASFDPFQPAAIARGLALGVGVALLFALGPLLTVRDVPPARVLRRDAEPLPPARGVRAASAALLASGVLLLAAAQSGSWLLGALFTAGLAGATLLLALAARGLLLAVTRAPRAAVPFWIRYGLAALSRPGAGTVGSVVALGVGVLVVSSLSLVERHLSRQLSAELPMDAPTAFLLDVQTDQWPAVKGLLAEAGATRIDSVPVVMARLTTIDGTPVTEIARQADGERAERQRWALTREQRLTTVDGLPADNRVVEGQLWSDPEPEVSLEVEFARRNLGARVGSHLDLDVQGVPLRLKVTSLRQVDWRTFGINFFFVVEPGVLDGAPQVRLAAARLPKEKEDAIQDLLAERFPNVTVVRTREVLERIAAVLDRLGGAVRALGGFTVLAGLAILAGAVAASTARRGREVALLKTLGVTRGGVAGTLAVEFALVGLVAGLIGTGGGALLSWAVVRHGFDVPWQADGPILLAGPAAAALLSALAGLAASARALRSRPLETFRGGDAG